ncbi:hypothetical protein Ahy_A08g040034 [Arachis hypogaea]|uniref:Peptidase C1A papain C-terminal domain-containing protein n=2 Tax=Arachis hypogaea TaxID=3818 RepID=A0A445BY23_ARAHY|nr:hypothetical protein Ahy_A08g040034 [Arachis hypogaea]
MDRTSHRCICGQNPSMCYAFIAACECRTRLEEMLHKPEHQRNLIELDVDDLVNSVKDFDDVFWALQYMGTVGVRSRPLSPTAAEIPGSEWTGRFKIKGIRRIPTTKLDQVKSYIREKCGVLATFRINQDFYSHSVAMPYERDRSTADNGFHNVCLTGYDDNKGIWSFLNSFGADWGKNGFGKIRYNHVVQYVVPIFMDEEILPSYENVQLPNDPAPPPVASTSSSSCDAQEHQTRRRYVYSNCHVILPIFHSLHFFCFASQIAL